MQGTNLPMYKMVSTHSLTPCIIKIHMYSGYRAMYSILVRTYTQASGCQVPIFFYCFGHSYFFLLSGEIPIFSYFCRYQI